MNEELVVVNGNGDINKPEIDWDIISYRKKLVDQYRKNRRGIKDLLRNGRLSIDDTLMLIAEEILEESESLLGNELITTEDGDIEKATSISVKRTDVLKSVADILAKKRTESTRCRC